MNIAKEIHEGYECRKPYFTNRLGSSQIGGPCSRALFYAYRHALQVKKQGRIIRLLDRGGREEELIQREIRNRGYYFREISPKTGKQFERTAFDGHFVVRLDGLVRGLPDYPKETLTTEIKALNERNFEKIQKDGVEKAHTKYYVQVQTGLFLFRLKRCLFIACNKNNDDMYSEIIEYDEDTAKNYMVKAKKIIYAKSPPRKISHKPQSYDCRYCDYKTVCHGTDKVIARCRSCKYAEIRGPEWLCTRGECYSLMPWKLPGYAGDGCANHIPQDWAA